MNCVPPDISLDFAPTPQTLWAVWGKAPDYQVKANWSDPVYQVWVLASPGSLGLEEIKQQMPNEFLAAAPLEQILAAKTLLSSSDRPSVGSWWPAWLPQVSSASFFLHRDADGTMSWEFGNESDPTNRPESQAVLEGRVRDFTDLCAQGERILSEGDYKSILKDARPVSPGHPRDWLHFMKAPARWLALRNLTGAISDLIG